MQFKILSINDEPVDIVIYQNDFVGEGIVLRCVEPGWTGSRFLWKSKGEKHSLKSKVKILHPVDIDAIEKLKIFVDSTVSINRLDWALNNFLNEKLFELKVQNLGEFIRIVYQDIVREEAESIIEEQIDVKKIGSLIANKSKLYFFEKLKEI